jgi:lysophospholipase L1-like esterase
MRVAAIAAAQPVVGPSAYTTLSASLKASDIILSDGDMQAESNSPTGGGSVLSVHSKNAGKFYFEVQPTQLYATNPGFLTGISIGSGTTGSYTGATTASFSIASTSTGSATWTNATQINTDAAGASNLSHYHRIAVDIDNGRLWLAASNRSSGAWIGGGDPAAGTSPTYTFTPGSTVYISLCPRRGDASNASDRNRLQLKVDPSEWAAAAPSGFAGWTTGAQPIVLARYNPTPSGESAIPGGALSEMGEFLDVEWVARADWDLQSNSSAFYAWSLDSNNHSLRYTGGVNGSWVLRVSGLDVLTAPTIELTAEMGQRAKRGQVISVRAWWDLALGTMGLRMAVNGCFAYQETGTPSGSPLSTPSSGWINSQSGGAGYSAIKQISFTAYGRGASRAERFIGCALGDSTVASYSPASGVPVASLLMGLKGRNRPIKSLAIGGATTAQQETQWTGFSEKAGLKWVVIQVGLNDLDPAEAVSVAIGRIQGLVDEVNASKPAGCQVYIAQMIPCYARLVTRYGAGSPADTAYAKWQAMNQAIAGGGGTPITGVDGRITAHAAAMDDGVGNLAAYDSGDGIHPNNAGRRVIADAWRPFLDLT